MLGRSPLHCPHIVSPPPAPPSVNPHRWHAPVAQNHCQRPAHSARRLASIIAGPNPFLFFAVAAVFFQSPPAVHPSTTHLGQPSNQHYLKLMIIVASCLAVVMSALPCSLAEHLVCCYGRLVDRPSTVQT